MTMMDGFQSLDDYVTGLHLPTHRRLLVAAVKSSVRLYSRLVTPWTRSRFRRQLAELNAQQGLTIELPEHGPAGEHSLTEDERQKFAQTGLLGPFPVLPAEDAETLCEHIRDAHARDFDGESPLGLEIQSILMRHGLWTLDNAGLYQGQRMPALQAVLQSTPISKRLASILGEDVVCWRTQFFEKSPGGTGTFWHQNGAFQETAKQRKLQPTEPVSLPILQLTVWLALTDVTVANGALRMMPGTFCDGRLERAYELAVQHPFEMLARIAPDKLDTLVRAYLHPANDFMLTQVVYECISELVNLHHDLVKKPVVDLTMKAGECVIFSSLNLHASHPNTTKDDTRLAFVARCTSASVRVYPDMDEEVFPTPEGDRSFPTSGLACFQVHGHDTHQHNRMVPSKVDGQQNLNWAEVLSQLRDEREDTGKSTRSN